MLITRKSMVSGITRTLDLPVTPEQISDWESGALIQNAMPHLSISDREFIVTGITDAEWQETFADQQKNVFLTRGAEQ